MEYAGFSREQIVRLKSDLRKASISGFMERVAAGQVAGRVDDAAAAGGPPNELEQAEVMKAKADALGVLRRAGVDANNAARLVGLEGVTFIPGQPITIKQPEEQ